MTKCNCVSKTSGKKCTRNAEKGSKFCRKHQSCEKKSSSPKEVKSLPKDLSKIVTSYSDNPDEIILFLKGDSKLYESVLKDKFAKRRQA